MIIKNWARLVLRRFGRDMVTYTEAQRAVLDVHPERHYRDLEIAAALTLPVGEISLEEAIFLGDLVAGLSHDGPIIEIGTLFGHSTIVMAHRKARARSLITVDNYSWNPLQISGEVHYEITRQVLVTNSSG